MRMFFRVSVQADSGVTIYLENEKVHAIDLSLGGAKFTHLPSRTLAPGHRVRMKIELEEDHIVLHARVVRLWSSQHRDYRPVQTVAVQFLDLEDRDRDVLQRKIRALERGMRFRELEESA